jgi:hypothetical protein
VTVYVVVALVGLGLIATGVALWSFPAGCVAAGVELLGVAYGGAYLQARRA